MKKNICLKSVLRRPIVALFLLLLIGSISFAFISRAVELVVIERESARIEGYYVASGTVGGTNEDVSAAVAVIDESQYLAYHDIRRYTTATLDGLRNGNILNDNYRYTDWGNFNSYYDMLLISGTVLSRDYSRDVGLRIGGSFYGGTWVLQVAVDQVLVGYPDCAQDGQTITLCFPTLNGEVDAQVIDGLEVGGRYLLRGFFDGSLVKRRADGGFAFPHWNYAYLSLTLLPLYTGEAAPYYLGLSPGEDFDLAASGLEQLEHEYRLADVNQRLMRISTSKNMAAMPNMAASANLYHIAKGRMLKYEDETSGTPVCVIENTWAKARGLEVGDTIRLSFQDFPALSFAQLVAEPTDDFLARWQAGDDDGSMSIMRGDGSVTQVLVSTLSHYDWDHTSDWSRWQSWADAPASPYIEFEIVGTFLRSRFVSYNDPALVFIPDAYLPQGFGENGEDGVVYGHQYSFVLKNATDQAAFMAETGEALAQLGFEVVFVENNIEVFQAAMMPVRQSTAFNAAVFATVLVLALALSAFIYLRQRRREFAILRALGVPRATAVGQMLLPMVLISGAGILGGGYLSWGYSLDKAGHTLAQIKLPDGIWTMVSLSPLWLAGMMGAVLALILAFTWAGAAVLARRPTLELIQGSPAPAKKPVSGHLASRAAAPAAPASAPAVTRISFVHAITPSEGGRPGAGAIWRHIWRHIWRAPLKSALCAGVALFFVLALGWMSHAIDQSTAQIDLLYQSTPVEAAIKACRPEIGSDSLVAYDENGSLLLQISTRTRERLEASEHVRDLYLERRLPGVTLRPGEDASSPGITDIALCAATQLERFYRAGTARISIDYAPGWDEAAFNSAQSGSIPVLLPADLVAALGFAPGGQVHMGDIELVLAGQYTLFGGEAGSHIRAFVPYSALPALEQDAPGAIFYDGMRIALSSDSTRDILMAQWAVGKILLDNTYAMAIEYNTDELNRVTGPMEKNLRLLRVLYPVTIAISAVIACGLALLLMLQTAREAAVMRVLGAPRLRVRAVLSVQQGLLCLIGLALGLAALGVIRQSFLGAAPLLCAVLYLASSVLGAAAASVLVSNKMPLELLQVKE